MEKDFKSDDKVVAVLYLFLENQEVPTNMGPVSSWNFAKFDLLIQDFLCQTLNFRPATYKLHSYTRSVTRVFTVCHLSLPSELS